MGKRVIVLLIIASYLTACSSQQMMSVEPRGKLGIMGLASEDDSGSDVREVLDFPFRLIGAIMCVGGVMIMLAADGENQESQKNSELETFLIGGGIALVGGLIFELGEVID